MEKIIDAAIGAIEVIVLSGIIGFVGVKGVHALHNQLQKETIEALKRPTPSLSRFTRQLTDPVR